MLKNIRDKQKINEHNKEILSVKEGKGLKKKNIPISNSFLDLKQLSEMCFTNFNGLFTFPKSLINSNESNNDQLKHKNDYISKSTHQLLIKKYNNNSPSSPKTTNNIINSKDSPIKKTNEDNDTINNNKTHKKNRTKSLNNSIEIKTQKDNNTLKISKSSSVTDIKDYIRVLDDLKTNCIYKIKSCVENKQKTSSSLNGSIYTLKSHVRTSSQELDKTKELNSTMSNNTMKNTIVVQRMQLVNKSVKDEIAKLKNECQSMKSKINELDKERIKIEISVEKINDELCEYRKQLRIFPIILKRCEEDKKNLTTAILIVKKKTNEIKVANMKIDNIKENFAVDLESMINLYQTHQEEIN